MKPRAKKLWNFAFIFGTLLIVILISVNGQEMTGAVDALRAVSPVWIVLCTLAYMMYTAFDTVSLWYFLRRSGHPITFRRALFVIIIGWYYSNITPGATGGQPMQIYYLNKSKVPIGIGTSALTVKYFCFQFMLMVVGTILWIAHGPFIAQQVGGSMWILVVGYAYNAVAVCAILLMAISRRCVWFLMKPIIKICSKLRIIKDPETTATKWRDGLETFHSSIMMLKKKPLDFVLQLALGTAQLLTQMLVIFFLFHAFNLTGAGYTQITALAVMQYISASYTPLPGASGAQEGVFSLYFAQIFPDGIRLMAMLLWRFFTYYLSLIVGAITTVANGFVPAKKKQTPKPDKADA